MKKLILSAVATAAIGMSMSVSAQALPYILSDEQAGAVCNEQMVGADVYLVFGTWPNAVYYRYVCNGSYWEITF